MHSSLAAAQHSATSASAISLLLLKLFGFPALLHAHTPINDDFEFVLELEPGRTT